MNAISSCSEEMGMMKSLLVLMLGFCIHQASAYADCGSFEGLVSKSQALQAPFGDLDHPQCSGKPDESAIDGVISCFEKFSGLPARNRARGDLELSGLYGVITQCYRSGLGQQATGKKSFDNLAASTQADPTFEIAWISFAETVAGMKQEGFFQRQAIQIGLGISIDDELQKAIQGLSALPQDSEVSAELAKLRGL